MVEFDRFNNSDKKSSPRLKVTVVGVGGGGLNVLDRISLDRVMEASLLAMDTDIRDLNHSMAQAKIQLGSDLILGIGSGGDPDLAAQAARQTADEIRGGLYGSDIVFITGGLGGGTCSGAAPVVAEIAKSLGAMVFVFASMPFSFQGRRTVQQAEEAREKLQKTADALILFENSRMGELVLPKEGIQKAFSQADQLIGHSIRAISSIVNQRGLIGMNVADVMAALKNHDSRCLFGYGEARGQNRVQEVLKRALKSPLINEGELLANAKNLLVHIAGGENFTLDEVQSLMTELSKKVPETTRIMFGLSSDAKLGDSVCLTLLSSLTAEDVIPGAKSAAVSTPVAASAPAPRASIVEETPVLVAQVPAPVPQPSVSPVVEVSPETPIHDVQEEIQQPVQAIEASLSKLIASHQASSASSVPQSTPEEVLDKSQVPAVEVSAPPAANVETQVGNSQGTTTPPVSNNSLSELTKVEPSAAAASEQEAPQVSPPVVTSSSLFKVVEEPLKQESRQDPEDSPVVEAPVTRKVVNPDWLERYISNNSQSSSPAPQSSAPPVQPVSPQPAPPPEVASPEPSAPPAQSSMFKVVAPAPQAGEPKIEPKPSKPEAPPSLQPAPSLASMFSVATSHLKEQNPNTSSINKNPPSSVEDSGQDNLDVPTWLRMRQKSKS